VSGRMVDRKTLLKAVLFPKDPISEENQRILVQKRTKGRLSMERNRTLSHHSPSRKIELFVLKETMEKQDQDGVNWMRIGPLQKGQAGGGGQGIGNGNGIQRVFL
jgi:hypothetical protein